MRTLAEIEADYRAADKDISDYESETRRLKRAVENERQPGLSELTARRSKFNVEMIAARDAEAIAAAHPWTGKKVERIEIEYSRWSSRETSRHTIYGVVETVTSGTDFPGNVTYGRPRVGTAIVRLLKKDGSTGLRFEELERRGDNEETKWRLS